MPQIHAGVPVLIWSGDGILAYFCADPQRDLMDDRWMATLLRAVADEYCQLSPLEVDR